MNERGNGLRVFVLALLTCLILIMLAAAGLYLRDSTLMREGDIYYNSGEYSSALACYLVLQDVFPFKQEAFQKADFCNYNLGREAMENEQWEDARTYFSEVRSFELNSVNQMLAECEKGIEAEADRAKSYDKLFLEDLEKAISLRLDPDDEGDVLSRELMFLGKYENAYFQDQKLGDYARQYLASLRAGQVSEAEVLMSERQLKEHDGALQTYEVLNGLYQDYDFMADNVKFVGEYIGNLESIRSYNRALHEIYNDMHRQIDPTTIWNSAYGYGYTYYNVLKNNTPYYVSLQFYYYIFTNNDIIYLGERTFSIDEVRPETDYLVEMSEADDSAGIHFYIDWRVTDIKTD